MSTTPAAPPPGARLYHGGIPGVGPGDLIEPHPPAVVDGCRICEARAAGEDPTVPGLGVVDPATKHPDRVYVTSDREYGRFHASKVWLGDLYQVEPVGDLRASTAWTPRGGFSSPPGRRWPVAVRSTRGRGRIRRPGVRACCARRTGAGARRRAAGSSRRRCRWRRWRARWPSWARTRPYGGSGRGR